MAHKVALWLNPASTNISKNLLSTLARRYNGCNTPLYHPSPISQYEPLLQADVVAILGGDGTARHVLNGLIKARGEQKISFPKILILPYGNGNALAHSVATHNRRKAPELLEKIIQNEFHSTISIPLIEIQPDNQETLYFTFASVGLDVEVITSYDQIWRGRLGKMGYLPAGLSHIFRLKPLHASLQDSQGFPIARNNSYSTHAQSLAPLITPQTVTFGVGTTSHYGWGLKALPFAQQAQELGMMHARSFNPINHVFHFLNNIPNFWSGEYQGPIISDAFAHKIHVVGTPDQPLPLEVAGDVIGYVPSVTFRIAPEYTFRFINGSSYEKS